MGGSPSQNCEEIITVLYLVWHGKGNAMVSLQFLKG
jgi:hypothetical protein